MIQVNSRKYYNQFINGTALGSNLNLYTNYLLGWVGGRYKRVTEIEVFAKSEASEYNTYTIGEYTITRETGSFREDGFITGDIIQVIGIWNSIPYDLDRTITNVTDLTITVNVALPSYGNDTISIIVCLKTPQYALNYFSNFVENEDPANFVSKVDSISTRKYTVDFTPAEYAAATIVTATPTGVNPSWRMTSDSVTAKCTQVPAAGNVYHQKFEITEIFTLTPFFDNIANLEDGTKPTYYEANNSLRHIAKFDAKPSKLNPITKHTITDDLIPETWGNSSYYDEHFNGYTPVEYSFNSIVYTNGEGESTISITETTGVTITIDSVNNLFLQDYSKFQLQIVFLNEEISLTANIDTNFTYDTCFALADGNSNSGDNGILSNVIGNVVADKLVITADVDFTIAQQALIEEGKFIMAVATTDHTQLIDAANTVNVLCDIGSFFANDDVPDLMGVDTNYFYEHPFDKGTQGKTDFKGWVEDGILLSSDFWLDTSLDAVIKTMNVRLMAYNSSTGNSFEFGKVPFNFSATLISSGIQEIDIDITRGFRLVDDSQFNLVRIQKMALVAGKQHYDLDIGIKLQWMDWIPLLDADTVFYDKTKKKNNLNHLTSNYSGLSNYEIVVFIDAVVSNGVVDTPYRFISPDIKTYYYDTDDTGDPSTKWSALVETFDQSSNDVSGAILNEENTDIKITYTSLTGLITEVVLYAIIRLEEYQQGGLTGIWELSSFRGAADNDPLIPLSGQSYTKITTGATTVITECSIDYERLNPSAQYKISGRMGTACEDITACAWEVKAPETMADLLAMDFVTEDIGYVCGTAGVLLKTIDGAETWTPAAPTVYRIYFNIFFLDASIGYVCGQNGFVSKTTDGGTTWVTKTAPSSSINWGLFFITEDLGFMGSFTDRIYKTTDSGATWTQKYIGTIVGSYIPDIYFIDATTGWACGSGGLVLKTTNVGEDWTAQTSGTIRDLKKIIFIDSSNGWCVGDSGTVLKTINGGTTWTGISIDATLNIFSISMVDVLNGWICTTSGRIYYTDDGGATWTQQTGLAIEALVDIQMISTTKGYACGYGGSVLEYTCSDGCDIVDEIKLMEDGTQKITESGFYKIKE